MVLELNNLNWKVIILRSDLNIRYVRCCEEHATTTLFLTYPVDLASLYLVYRII